MPWPVGGHSVGTSSCRFKPPVLCISGNNAGEKWYLWIWRWQNGPGKDGARILYDDELKKCCFSSSSNVLSLCWATCFVHVLFPGLYLVVYMYSLVVDWGLFIFQTGSPMYSRLGLILNSLWCLKLMAIFLASPPKCCNYRVHHTPFNWA